MCSNPNWNRNIMQFLLFMCLWISSSDCYDIYLNSGNVKPGNAIFNASLRDSLVKWEYTIAPKHNRDFYLVQDLITIDAFTGVVYSLKPFSCEVLHEIPLDFYIVTSKYSPDKKFHYVLQTPINIYIGDHNCGLKPDQNKPKNDYQLISTQLDPNFGNCIEKNTAVLSLNDYIPKSVRKCGLKYSINGQDLLYIDSTTGIIYTKYTFCFELPFHSLRGSYNLTKNCKYTEMHLQKPPESIPFEILLYANSDPKDHLTETLSMNLGETKLKFRQRRETNNQPEFPQKLYIKSVEEERNPGYVIDTITATDDDSGEDGTLRYSLKATNDGRSQAMFTIDENSGQLSTSQKLDREVLDEHSFLIYATDGGSPSLTATTELRVYVDDINDHPPVFEIDSYSIDVPESISIGSTVITVRASDSDEGQNAEIEYSILNPTGLNTVFRIESRNGGGEITTRDNLDRETTARYTLRIQATDSATVTQRRTAIATVEIIVLDDNDNKPQFSQNSYTVEVWEDIDPSGTPIIAEIRASDADDGSNARIRYSITGGNNEGTFKIDEDTGQMSVLEALDYEKTPGGFSLNIRAQDGGSPPKASSANVLVRVKDINDNTPRFYTSVYHETVEEDVGVGSTIMRINAYDADSGENSRLSYVIKEGADNMPLVIDTNTGYITTNASLDRETDAHYSFKVIASDHGETQRSSTATVDITVRDVNDNNPVFDQKVYDVVISEEDPPGTPLVTVRAKDEDEDEKVDYSITNGNIGNAFNIIRQMGSGLITLANYLDYKERNRYELTITATDSGGRIDTAAVFVNVSDANTFRPAFQDTPYQVRIDEDVDVGSTIFTVLATDGDVGANAQIVYKMDESDVLSINPQSGAIFVKAALDREQTAGYTFSITATDRGRPPKSDTTDIEIIVEDVNDNFPKFTVQEYKGQIAEDVSSDTSVLTIEASDSDEGSNGRIRYTFDGGNNGGGDFRIEQNSGVLRTNTKLDREKVASYDLVAFAVDRGSPEKSTSVDITVKILDVNDNAPQFETNKIHMYIKENSAIGSQVDTVQATDPDEGENAVVEYIIVGGPDKDSFILRTEFGKPAIIETAIELDYEGAKKEYLITLQAVSKHLFSDADIVIHVQDVNDNMPLMKDFTIIVNNYEGYFPSGMIGSIPASDPDVDDRLRYRIISGNQANSLHLDEETGALQLDSRLNSDVPYNGTMQVSVTDGINDVKATAHLFVRLVTIDMLYHSITVRLNNIDTIAFLSPLYNLFASALASIIPTTVDNIFIVNIQDDTDVEEKVLNVSFSVRKRLENNKDIFYSQDFLKERIYLQRVLLAKLSTLEILPFDDNLCITEPCLNFDHCLIILKFGEAAPFVWSDTILFRPIHPISKFTCVCPAGFAGMEQEKMCDTEVNLCYSNPCANNASCIQKEGGYNCLCTEGFAGEHCEVNLDSGRYDVCPEGVCKDNSQCTPLIRGGFRCEICPFQNDQMDQRDLCTDCAEMQHRTKFCELRTRSFTEGTFLMYPSLKKRHRFTIRLKFATRESNALLFYNGRFNEKHDFIAMEIIGGQVQFSFSLGSEVVRVKATVPGGVNDGNWHEVQVKYLNRTAILTVGEDCDSELSLQFGRQVGNYGCASSGTQTLEERCDNPTQLCHRLLDLTGPFQIGGVPSLPTDFQIQNLGFVGCIQDVMIDESFLDLNDYVWNNGTKEGCSQKNGYCQSSPCEYGGLCTEGWTTFKCECPPTKSGRTCKQVVEAPYNLQTTSHLLFGARKPNAQLPWYNSMGFRTRSNSGMLMQVEVGTTYVKLMLKDGLIHCTQPENSAILEGIRVNDGVWHNIEVQWRSGGELQITLDYGQVVKKYEFGDWLIGQTVNKVYIGGREQQVSPGTEPYTGINGCVQDIRVGNGPTAILSDPTLSNLNRAESGCTVTNPCEATPSPCPSNSVCIDEWQTHRCECNAGRAGPNCDKICNRYNPCMGETFCETTNDGYFCKCKEGQSGKYCEEEIQTTCPATWWGSPICGPCNCDVSKGFDPSCKHTGGTCVCKTNHYKPADSDTCFPCECYELGTVNNSKACHSVTGQCYCKEEVVGRRCDECNSKFAEVTSRGCEVRYDDCPRNHAGGMWWGRTPYESIRWLPCPHIGDYEGTVGNASRTCSKTHGWSKPDMFNCTSLQFLELAKRNYELATNKVKMNTYLAKELARNIHEATDTTKYLFGSDIFISYQLVKHILNYENSQSGLNLTHTQDRHFIQYIVNAIGTITARKFKDDWMTIQSKSLGAVELLHKLEEYINTLATNVHQVFTQPFDAVHDNIGLDTILKENMTSVTIPKFNNKVQDLGIFDKHTKVFLPVDEILTKPKSSNHYKEEILINSRPVAAVGYVMMKNFGEIVPNNFDESIIVPKGIPLTLNSPVFSLTIVDKNQTLTGGLQAPIVLQLKQSVLENRTSPHCVYWQYTSLSERSLSGTWSTEGCILKAEEQLGGDKYIICECDHMTSFGVVMAVYDRELPATEAITIEVITYIGFTVALICFLVVFILFCCMRGIESNANSIHVNLAFALFVANLAYVAGIDKVQPQLGCKFVAIALHYFYLSTFAWMFVEVLHLYRMITEIRNVNHGSMKFYYMLGYVLPGIIVCLAVGLHTEGYGENGKFCWLETDSLLVWWSFSAPIILVVVMNVIVFAMALKAICTTKEKEDLEASSHKNALRAVLLIMPLLSFTWIFGLYSVNDDITAYHYLFAVLTCSQGVLLLLGYIVFNRHTRKDLKYTLQKLQGKKDLDDSISGTRTSMLSRSALAYNHHNDSSLDGGLNRLHHTTVGISTTSTTSRSTTDNSKSGAYRGEGVIHNGGVSSNASNIPPIKEVPEGMKPYGYGSKPTRGGSTNKGLDSDSDSELSAMEHPDMDLASSHSSDEDDDVAYPPWVKKPKHPLQGPPQPPPSKPSSAKTRPVATVLPSTSSSQATSINRPVVHPTVPIIVPSPQELVPNNNTVYVPPYSKVPTNNNNSAPSPRSHTSPLPQHHHPRTPTQQHLQRVIGGGGIGGIPPQPAGPAPTTPIQGSNWAPPTRTYSPAGSHNSDGLNPDHINLKISNIRMSNDRSLYDPPYKGNNSGDMLNGSGQKPPSYESLISNNKSPSSSPRDKVLMLKHSGSVTDESEPLLKPKMNPERKNNHNLLNQYGQDWEDVI